MLSLPEGSYRLERKGEPAVEFKVPESGTLVLGAPPSEGLEAAIDAALEPPTAIRAGEGQ